MLTFGFMIGFLIVISAIIIGIFMYVLTIQKVPIFGIMKAQGISNANISNAVLSQTLLLSLVGSGLGLIEHLKTKLPKEISGGERQRLAIARTLYNNSALVLADEPTASLDTEKAYDVVHLLSKECREKNKGIIMVTHDKRMIEECDKIYEMSDGYLKQIK